MVKQSENIVHRLFDRQICNRPSNTQLHRVRRFYENIVPSHTVYDVECPDYTFRKFTYDGQYLVAFSRNAHELVIFKFNWFTYCLKGSVTDDKDELLPPKSRKFESFFTLLYSVPLASGAELICKDFFFTTDNSSYAILATSTPPQNDPLLTPGAVPGVPSMEKITIHVVRLSDGTIVDERVYNNDYIQLSHNTGVFMYEDLLTVLSVRYQCIHILQIRDSGMLVDVRKIGDYCREDDQLLINTQLQKEADFQNLLRKSKGMQQLQQQPMVDCTTKRQQQTADAVATQEPQGLLRNSGPASFDHRTGSTSEARSDVASGSGGTYPHSSLSVNNNNVTTYGEPPPDRVLSYVVSSRAESMSARPLNQGGGNSPDVSAVVTQDDTTLSSSGSRHFSMARSLDSSAVVNDLNRGFYGQASISSTVVDAGTSGTLRRTNLQEETTTTTTIADNTSQAKLLCGIKQRLLSYIFRTHQDSDPIVRTQRFKRFYYLFQDYVDLAMWKVQFLDRQHLLIKFGSVDGVVSRSSEAPQQTAFFVVYNFETTEVVEFQQNSSEELLRLLENFADHFRVSQRYPLLMSYITSCSNNAFLREQLRKQRSACRNSSSAQTARRSLASIPVKAQSQSPSAYFDHSLFQFDEKLISATDRHRPCMEHPIKFISRRRPNALKFKINPGPETGSSDGGGRMKRVAAFIFHPVFPFALSIQQSYMQPTVVNFHFRK